MNIPKEVKAAWYTINNNNYTIITIDRYGEITSCMGFKVLPAWKHEGAVHLVYRESDFRPKMLSMRELYRDILYAKRTRIFWMDKNSPIDDIKIGGTD